MAQISSESANSVQQDQLKNLISLYNKGQLGEAIALGEALVAKSPQSIDIYNILGIANARLRRFDKAIDCFKKVLQIKPDFADGHNNLGIILKDIGRREEAIDCFTRALQIKPDYVGAHYNLGIVRKDLGQREEAIDGFTKALQIKPDFAEAHNNLGIVLKDLGRREEAINCYTKALQIKPDYAEAHNNLGIVLKDLGRREEAIDCYTKALQINPNFVGAHYNLGISLQDLGRRSEAINCYAKVLQIKPDYAEAHNNLGIVLQDLGQREKAVDCYTKALQIKPGYAEAHNNLGVSLKDLGRRDEAIDSFTKALQIKPDYAEALAAKLYQQANICDWTAIDADADAIASLGISGAAVSPFEMLSLEDDPARHRVRSERYALKKYERQTLPSFARPSVKPDRLRIGYFSADFHNHPGMHLMAGLFEEHDRDRFVVHAYSFGPEKNDPMRARLKDAFDVFHDVRSLSDQQVANLARKDSIDIAINRNGYTNNERSNIFAHRAAPIQINYLGYPGTLGAKFIDYIISDKFIIPDDKQEHYSEKIIYLPHTYQANDNSRAISDAPMARQEMGLPGQGFVFCCFNNIYKIGSKEFDIWMRLLQEIDGSVLWLLKPNNWAEANLKEEARARGIDPERIVFAERQPLPEHLARHRLADLFLDTFNYNAHTTASDALWAGLPVVTKTGQGFATRVAGSLLSAIGLPELITNTDDDYERLALQLASNPDKLNAINSKLEKNRDTTPLFDTEGFARHIEDAYQQAYQRYFDGKYPDVIEVQA